jgi:pimeloyl-ACP methyl ester carboxylesterase
MTTVSAALDANQPTGLFIDGAFVGAEDTLTPPAEAEKMVAGIKGAKLARIPGAGHLPNIEAPAVFDLALQEFVAGLPK